jgi:putative oxidoreductase
MAIQIIFWVLIAAYVIPGYIFGTKKLIGHKHSIGEFKRFGYPLWFMHVLGLAEITGSTLMLFSATRIYGIAIFPVILAGAVYTHLKVRDGKKVVMKPVIAGMVLLVIFLFTFLIPGICVTGL